MLIEQVPKFSDSSDPTPNPLSPVHHGDLDTSQVLGEEFGQLVVSTFFISATRTSHPV